MSSQNGSLLVDYEIPETLQDDLEKGQANWYEVIPSSPFSRSSVSSIDLRIGGDDAWLPKRLFLFGLDQDAQMPQYVVPFVCQSDWQDWLSTDTSEDQQSVELPLADLAKRLEAAAQ